MKRIVNTCFGKFRIEKDRAISIADDEFYYTLPHENMSDREIVKHFIHLHLLEH